MCINIHHLLFSAKKNAQKDACRFPYFQKYTQIYVFLLFSIAFIAFFIGSAILPRYFLNKEFKKPAIEFKSKDLYSIGFCLVLISILFFFASVASVGGIPILKTSLRYQLKPLFTMPVFLIIPGVCILASAYLKKFQENKITRSACLWA